MKSEGGGGGGGRNGGGEVGRIPKIGIWEIKLSLLDHDQVGSVSCRDLNLSDDPYHSEG